MPRFTTRDLLWLMLVVGMAGGWFASHHRTVREWRAKLIEVDEWREWERKVTDGIVSKLDAEGRDVAISADGTVELGPVPAVEGQ